MFNRQIIETPNIGIYDWTSETLDYYVLTLGIYKDTREIAYITDLTIYNTKFCSFLRVVPNKKLKEKLLGIIKFKQGV